MKTLDIIDLPFMAVSTQFWPTGCFSVALSDRTVAVILTCPIRWSEQRLADCIVSVMLSSPRPGMVCSFSVERVFCGSTWISFSSSWMVQSRKGPRKYHSPLPKGPRIWQVYVNIFLHCRNGTEYDKSTHKPMNSCPNHKPERETHGKTKRVHLSRSAQTGEKSS